MVWSRRHELFQTKPDLNYRLPIELCICDFYLISKLLGKFTQFYLKTESFKFTKSIINMLKIKNRNSKDVVKYLITHRPCGIEFCFGDIFLGWELW